ncbi:MAG: DNA replication/repair protein RecF [Candidatus Limnocylindrales bacterium]|nr:DNA replication/repair protein RecF [Candidatus Limnocylindrales bacterium]
MGITASLHPGGRSGAPARPNLLATISLLDFRGYPSLDVAFGPGPHLIWGPNAAGKTSLLEAMVLLAWGRSHRTSADGELVRWGADLARVEGHVGSDVLEVAVVRAGATGTAGRKRIQVNGLGRRAAGLAGLLRVVVFAPEVMLLIAGSPSLRRAVIDQLASSGSPAYADAFATYGRVLQQRNGLLRAIREEGASRDELRFWDSAFLDAGGAIVAERRRLLETLAGPLSAAHAEIAPDEAAEARLTLSYATNAPPLPGESPRDALARRLVETAEKEVWNGSTLVGPHRDDLVFELAGRDLASFASRGQQRTAILALKLAELDLLAELDGRPPLLLLDDVFSELDPERRSHLVRRIAALPQTFITTTTLDDLAPELRAIATAWEVRTGPNGAWLAGAVSGTGSPGGALR